MLPFRKQTGSVFDSGILRIPDAAMKSSAKKQIRHLAMEKILL
jgi:hypothetical protein